MTNEYGEHVMVWGAWQSQELENWHLSRGIMNTRQYI